MKRALGVSCAALVLALAAPAYARPCHEESESGAVGYATCHRFGEWRTPTFRMAPELTLGLAAHRFALDGRSLGMCGGSTCKPIAYGGDASIAGASELTTYGALARVGLLALGPLRAGVYAEAGAGGGSEAYHAPGAVGRGSNFSFVNVGVFGGARFGLGHAAFDLDLVAASQQLSGSIDALRVRGVGSIDAVSDGRFVLLADGSALYYVHPYVAIGVGVGVDVLHRDDVFGALTIRFASSPFDALR